VIGEGAVSFKASIAAVADEEDLGQLTIAVPDDRTEGRR
jgi:hypothetical protein